MTRILRPSDLKLSPKARAELDEIKAKVEEDLRPMYEALGVDIKTEQLMWVSGEVYVIDANGKRREIGEIHRKNDDGTTEKLDMNQTELNKHLFGESVKLAKKSKEEEK